MSASFFISLEVALGGLLDALVLLAIIFLGRGFYRFVRKVQVEKEVMAGNTALSVALAGYLLGLGIAASGGLLVDADGWHKSLMIGLVGLVSMALLEVSLFINDNFILSHFRNMEEIQKNNLGVAFIEAGGCVATGLMINGVMSGKAEGLVEKAMFAGIYWAIGQAILVLGSYFFRPICGYHLDDDLGSDRNAAAGLSFGGFLVSLGIVIQSAMHGVSTEFFPEIATIGVFFVIGFAMLIIGKILLARVLMPSGRMFKEIDENGNTGAAALSAVGYICIAVVFAASISPAMTFAAFKNYLTPEPPKATIIIHDSADTRPPISKEYFMDVQKDGSAIVTVVDHSDVLVAAK